MDEEVRTCGSCKGRAQLEGVEETSTEVTYTAAHIPLGSERLEGGARIYYACTCGNRFSFISNLRRARYVGGVLLGAAFGSFWWYMATAFGRRESFGRQDDTMSPFMLMAGAFGLVAAISTLLILADVVSRLRNPRWLGD